MSNVILENISKGKLIKVCQPQYDFLARSKQSLCLCGRHSDVTRDLDSC